MDKFLVRNLTFCLSTRVSAAFNLLLKLTFWTTLAEFFAEVACTNTMAGVITAFAWMITRYIVVHVVGTPVLLHGKFLVSLR